MTYPITIAILCGGRSRRFGEDKTKISLEGKPLYKRTWEKFEPYGKEIFLQASSGDRYPLPFKVDVIDKDIGSLAGIYSALCHSKFDWVFIVAGDLPYIDEEIISLLWSKTGEGATTVVPVWPEGHFEPLAALYHTSLVPLIEDKIREENYKISDLYGVIGSVKKVYIEDHLRSGTLSENCFHNLNRPEDL